MSTFQVCKISTDTNGDNWRLFKWVISSDDLSMFRYQIYSSKCYLHSELHESLKYNWII